MGGYFRNKALFDHLFFLLLAEEVIKDYFSDVLTEEEKQFVHYILTTPSEEWQKHHYETYSYNEFSDFSSFCELEADRRKRYQEISELVPELKFLKFLI